ncbi:MAG: extracellular solute-binding protein [Holosporaceae bacterium]|jgi:spermidine/putrescine-binding protein|nr:extracellular solute-binding protein [Holosporaceae bacterium]
MKRCIFTILLLCIISLAFSKNYRKSNHVNDELQAVVSQMDFSDLDAEKMLYIDVGIDYLPYELVELFETATGISVVTDIFDSNEILEAKLLAGGARYDLVFPTAWPHFSRQLKSGIYQKINVKKIDYSIFEPSIVQKMSDNGGCDVYGLPYQFGISGIGLNKDMVDNLVQLDSKDTLALIFDPPLAEKLSKYRISIYESPHELFPAVLAYLGLDPETEREEDIIAAAEHLKKIRRYIAKFTSYGFEDLASGNSCATLGTSGDIMKVMRGNARRVEFFLPKEGASLWVDVIAIPLGARHLKNAYAFIKFLLHPQIIAYITNKTYRANAVVAADKFVDSDLVNNVYVYPDAEMQKKCYIEKSLPPRIEYLKTRLLTKIKSMDSDEEG